MKEYKWGRIMVSNQFGIMITWGESIIPKRKYISIDLPFLIFQIYINGYNAGRMDSGKYK
jgi:hypothetical protein